MIASLGKRLKELRGEVSQTAAAKGIGTDQQTLSRYEKCERNPDAEMLLRIAQYYGVSCDYLLGLSEAKTTDSTVQCVHSVTGLSESAISELAAMKDTPDDKSYHTIVSALLEDISFERVIALIDAKNKLQTVPDNEYDKFEQLFENWKSIKISGQDYHVETSVLLDSLIQGEFLKVVNDACKRMEG